MRDVSQNARKVVTFGPRCFFSLLVLFSLVWFSQSLYQHLRLVWCSENDAQCYLTYVCQASSLGTASRHDFLSCVCQACSLGNCLLEAMGATNAQLGSDLTDLLWERGKRYSSRSKAGSCRSGLFRDRCFPNYAPISCDF